jgi:hypothetical protein
LKFSNYRPATTGDAQNVVRATFKMPFQNLPNRWIFKTQKISPQESRRANPVLVKLCVVMGLLWWVIGLENFQIIGTSVRDGLRSASHVA